MMITDSRCHCSSDSPVMLSRCPSRGTRVSQVARTFTCSCAPITPTTATRTSTRTSQALQRPGAALMDISALPSLTSARPTACLATGFLESHALKVAPWGIVFHVAGYRFISFLEDGVLGRFFGHDLVGRLAEGSQHWIRQAAQLGAPLFQALQSRDLRLRPVGHGPLEGGATGSHDLVLLQLGEAVPDLLV